MAQFKAVKLINKDNSVSDFAALWRDDKEYPKYCKKLREELYPDELLQLAVDPEKDYNKAVRWFMRATGVSDPTARQMANLYQILLIADPGKGDEIAKSTARKGKTITKNRETKPDKKKTEEEIKPPFDVKDPKKEPFKLSPNINLNIQIHIDANASLEQINQIFKCMADHFSMASKAHE